jgi:DNA-directed RNA polymerase sigma subunit (sigma70/sigma32)
MDAPAEVAARRAQSVAADESPSDARLGSGEEALRRRAERARRRSRDLARRLAVTAARPELSERAQQLERELVLAAQREGGAAREGVLEAFAPLIASMARRYGGNVSVQRDDLIQEGAAGLLRALERYDAERGVPFWGYASWWVRQAMQQLVSERWRSRSEPRTASTRR